MISGDRIKELREARGMSQADLAARIGVSQAAIQKIEKGTTRQSKYAYDIAKVLGVPGESLSDVVVENAFNVVEAYGHRLSSRGKSLVENSWALEKTPIVGMPVHDGRGSVLFNWDPIGFALRPPSIVGVENAYAMYVHTSLMMDRFKPGELVWTNTNLPVLESDDVVVQFKDNADALYPLARICRLSRYDGGNFVGTVLRPEDGNNPTFTIPRAAIVGIHKIILTGMASA